MRDAILQVPLHVIDERHDCHRFSIALPGGLPVEADLYPLGALDFTAGPWQKHPWRFQSEAFPARQRVGERKAASLAIDRLRQKRRVGKAHIDLARERGK